MAAMLPSTHGTPCANDAATVPLLSALARTPLFHKIVEAQQEDPSINRDAIRWRDLQNRPHRTTEEQAFLDRNRLTDSGSWRRNIEQEKWKLQVPESLRSRVIWEYHDAALAGHPGTEETIRSIQEIFYCPGINREVRRYVADCHLCICCKPVRGRQPGNQRPRPARRAWDTVAVDLMGLYPRTSQGHRFILVVTDLFSRWVEAFKRQRPSIYRPCLGEGKPPVGCEL